MEAGVSIEEGKILSISKSDSLPGADRTIDLNGSLLLPGVVDPHVHFREPGLIHKENFSTGSMAATAGGVTTVCEMPNTLPATDSLENFKEKREIGESNSIVDFGLHGMLSVLTEEGKRMLDAGAASLKLYPEICDDSEVLNFEDEGDILTVHPEDPQVLGETEYVEDVEAFIRSRPREAEVSEIKRIFNLASGSRLHFCHVTTEDSLKLIERRREGGGISCEVTPHHLWLDQSDLMEQGAIAKTHPPLRPEGDGIALLKALEGGSVDVVASDHAPHTLDEKFESFRDAPPGIAGVETSLPLLHTLVDRGKLSLSRMVEAMCSSPAEVFGLRNEEGVLKGTLRSGADADLVALDQDEKWEIRGEDLHGKTKFTPFEGVEVVGKPFLTLVRGEIVFRDGEIVGEEGHGRFIPAGR